MWPVVLGISAVCLGNCVALYMLWRKKQHLEALQHKQEKQIEQQRNAIKSISRRLESYLTGSMRMGEELHELQKNLGPLPEKILRMEQNDPSSLSFTQAARLIGLGASTEDLKQSCGLSQSEAELLQRMHSKRK